MTGAQLLADIETFFPADWHETDDAQTRFEVVTSSGWMAIASTVDVIPNGDEYDTIDVYYGELEVRDADGTVVRWRDPKRSTHITAAASRLRATIAHIYQTTGGLRGD